jgi:hypothetical protein
MSRLLPIVVLIAAVLGTPAAALADAREVSVSLSGSRASMQRQNRIAKEEQYSFLRTPAQVRSYVDHGRLVEVEGNTDYDVIAGYPFARPVVRAFVERLAARYRAACGEKLVVTSLTRPSTRQPGNASPLSVHPAGMAVDLRVSRTASCRGWLEAELLELEDMGLLDATLERNPPHFHVAVFPAPFSEYDQVLADEEAAEAARRAHEDALAAWADSVAAAIPTPTMGPAAPQPVQRAPRTLLVIAAVFMRVLVPFLA